MRPPTRGTPDPAVSVQPKACVAHAPLTDRHLQAASRRSGDLRTARFAGRELVASGKVGRPETGVDDRGSPQVRSLPAETERSGQRSRNNTLRSPDRPLDVGRRSDRRSDRRADRSSSCIAARWRRPPHENVYLLVRCRTMPHSPIAHESPALPPTAASRKATPNASLSLQTGRCAAATRERSPRRDLPNSDSRSVPHDAGRTAKTSPHQSLLARMGLCREVVLWQPKVVNRAWASGLANPCRLSA